MGQRPPYNGIPVTLQQQFANLQKTSPLFTSLLTSFFANGGQIAATPRDKSGTYSDLETLTIYPDPTWFSPDADILAVVLAHELGHQLIEQPNLPEYDASVFATQVIADLRDQQTPRSWYYYG